MRARMLSAAVLAVTVLTMGGPDVAVPTARAEDGWCSVPDVYPTLQSAVDDPACLVVHAAHITYLEQLTIRRSLTLAGRSFEDRVSTLSPPPTMTAPGALLNIIGRKVRVKVKHFRFAGPGPDEGLIGIRAGKDTQLTIRDSVFRDIRPASGIGTGDFIAIHSGVPSDIQITRSTISAVRFEKYHGAAILVEGPGTVTDITLTTVGPAGARLAAAAAPRGIIVRDGAFAAIYRNSIAGHRHPHRTGIGILLEGPAATSSLQYNAVDRSDAGIKLVGAAGVWVYRNALEDNGDGIVVTGDALPSSANRIQRNRVDGGTGVGLRVGGATANQLWGNELRANAGGGVVTEAAAAGNAFSGNRADNNGGWGMQDLSTGDLSRDTANTYSSTNYCRANALGPSSPRGLCRVPSD